MSCASLIFRALDPACSVVVEACAGSGKTWLLASRIVRLLLLGVAPGEILAITFTRKAAGEIEERVVGWLQLLATASDADVRIFLAERGADAGEDAIRRARGLYERVLSAQPGLTVNTFHGWFLQLIDVAPLSANLTGMSLVESDSRLFDEVWQSFAVALQKNPDSEVTTSFVRLLDCAGLEMCQQLIRRAFNRRSEWYALAVNQETIEEAIAAHVIDELQLLLDVSPSDDVLEIFFVPGWADDVQSYLGLLEMSDVATDVRCAQHVRRGLETGDRDVCFSHLCDALLSATGTLRKRELTKAAAKRFSPAGAERLVTLHEQLGARALECRERFLSLRILVLNRDVCAVFTEFLQHIEQYKRARRQIDFGDAEWKVLQLLRDDMTAAFIQARLDARYGHVLLDEFQDTNPLQWQILRAWLGAYSDAARPCIFLVGDPKQSIYRFRRAEPRLFSVAADFLEREYGAIRCEQDVTRRNAQAIIDVVNALFSGKPAFAPFRNQSSLAGELAGYVELLPLFGRDDTEDSENLQASGALRNPLREPLVEAEDLRRRKEADALAEKIAEIVGHRGHGGEAWQIVDKSVTGGSALRAARYGDILLLVRTRSGLAIYERALSAAGIPFDAGSRGGLLLALEVRDIMALVEFLVTPPDDLKLAHVLRSPLFACNDDDLLSLASGDESSWWQRLVALSQSKEVSPALARGVRLLSGWLEAADFLPAHDLLDRIFHEGEVLARYRLAVPRALVASVEANLRALLLLALDLDGGRYPSLPRFIDELRKLRDADANDAPDEGEIELQHADGGRVRILTIHGAKGLEAPIVWLLGANSPLRPSEPWDVLVDWPPEAEAPRHFSFFGRKEERGVARAALFDAEAVAAQREELNLLYVAITRARQVFIASGIAYAKASDGTPYRLLEDALNQLGEGSAYGNALSQASVCETHQAAGPVSALPDVLPVIGERKSLPGDAERFGTLLHAVLERRTGGVEADGWWRSLGFDDESYRRVAQIVARLMTSPNLQRFFDPLRYRRAWNEIDVTDGSGGLRRIDRLVDVEGALWVLDYKSSGQETERLDEYMQQVRAYCQIVKAAHAERIVKGALLFADGSLLEVSA